MSLKEAENLLQQLQKQEDNINKFVETLRNAKKNECRVWLAGNGGSSATISHFASDLMNLGFDVFCMVDNKARLTALTNDYGWELVYTKQLNYFKERDVLILMSVHGGEGVLKGPSENLLLVTIHAKTSRGEILSLLGCDGGRLKDLSDVSIIVPSDSCCYVEGIHSLLCHIICERLKVEKE